MFAVPASIPVTNPVVATTVAVPAALLLQVPDGDEQLNVVVAPSHTCKVPVTGAGTELTVTTAVTLHPVPNV